MLLPLLLAQSIASTPAPTPAPLDIYRRTIKIMRSIEAPSYLEYDVRIHTIHKGREAVQHFDEFTNVEKTIDRTGRLYVSGDPKTFTSFVRIHPDLFLGHRLGEVDSNALTVQTGAEPDQDLKTIATVSAQNQVYDVTMVGTEDLPACSSATHLALKPLLDPLRYNLRDVWINPTTSRICRAVAIWRDPVEFAVPIPTVFTVTLDVDSNGFVNHWATTGVARFIGMPYAMTQDWTYSNITPVTETALETLGKKSQ
jgi:hypothetical protein